MNPDRLHRAVFQKLTCTGEQYGIMKASELARPPMRSASQPSSAAASSPLTPGPPKGLHTGGGGSGAGGGGSGGGRLQQGGSQPGTSSDQQQQQHDSFVIYELFTSSVVALILYFLVKDHQAIALNYRTVVSRPLGQSEPDAARSAPQTAPHRLTNISVFWASSGTLVVSTYSLASPEIRSLDLVDAEELKDIVGKCVRVAPNGMLAQITGFDDPVETPANDAKLACVKLCIRVNAGSVVPVVRIGVSPHVCCTWRLYLRRGRAHGCNARAIA